MFGRSRVRRGRARSPPRKQNSQERKPKPVKKHKKAREAEIPTNSQRLNNHYDIHEATAFICEFDKTIEHFKKVEKNISSDAQKISNEPKEKSYDLDDFLKETQLGKTQKQALLLLLLCYEADFPASMFSTLCESVTMRKIMDKLFQGKNASRLLEEME